MLYLSMKNLTLNKTFTSAKQEFDSKFENNFEFECFLSEHLTFGKKNLIKNKAGQKNEEYYKWQFLYGIVYSGMFDKFL